MHVKPTPRIGGVAALAGLATFAFIFFEKLPIEFMAFIICSLPAFVSGFLEDLTKNVSKMIRLIACLFSGFLVAYSDITIQSIAIPAFVTLLENAYISAFVTILAVGFLAQAMNIIDGLNGLALFSLIFPMSSILLISIIFNDLLIRDISLYFIATYMGLLIFNFPNGKIFIGDCGAYMSGVFLACVVIFLSVRTSIAPFACLLLVLYPMFEMFFSVGRRFIHFQTKIIEADNDHLHSKIYQVLETTKIFSKEKCNSAAACLCAIPVGLLSGAAYLFHKNNFAAIMTTVAFCAAYTFSYISLNKYLGKKTDLVN